VGLWSRYLAWRLRHVTRIVTRDGGFSLERHGAAAGEIDWAEIETIHAFKRDLYTVDMICLLFTMLDGSAIEVNEGMPGYEALSEQLVGRPGVKVAWMLDVMFPAFEPCLTQIYPVEATP
jgi:hypothetical protein